MSQIEFIEIKYISSSIPQLLLNKLEVLEINDIQGILNTSVESFKSKKGIGAKAIGLFKNLREDIIKNPNKYHEIYLDNKEVIIPEIYYDNYNIIENIKLFTNDYEKIFENKRDIDIIRKKYGIGNDIFTLEEIGTFYDLTRERVRQIKEAEIRKIKNLFNGDFNLKLNCKCRQELVNQISKLLSFLDNRSSISYRSINTFLKEEFNFQTKEEDKNYLTFLLNIYGYDDIIYLNNLLYYKSSIFSNETIKQLLTEVTQEP